jgi:hypothetical protein
MMVCSFTVLSDLILCFVGWRTGDTGMDTFASNLSNLTLVKFAFGGGVTCSIPDRNENFSNPISVWSLQKLQHYSQMHTVACKE